MLDVSTGLATLLHSPDVDLGPHRFGLEQNGIRSAPIAFDTPPVVGTPVVYLLSPAWWQSRPAPERSQLIETLRRPSVGLILTGDAGDDVPVDLDEHDLVDTWLDLPPSGSTLRTVLRASLRAIRLRLELAEANRLVERRTFEMREIQRVGAALSSERDITRLQQMILRISRELTTADAGTIYLVEQRPNRKVLILEYTQNDSVDAPYKRLELEINKGSISGFVAATGEVIREADVYRLPPDRPYSFSPAIDRKFGYRTTSMLVVPMRNHEGQVVGVIQLINKKSDPSIVLYPDCTASTALPFTQEDEDLLLSFASQAAVALENRRLIESIEELFEGFILASVRAIESRDPTTSGHSNRVASLTVGLAEAVNEVHVGALNDIHFNEEQLKEIRYAGLLHDFGKIGVREAVLVKPKKLYDWNLAELRNRFAWAREVTRNKALQRRFDFLLENGAEALRAREAELLAEEAAALAEIDQMLEIVMQANEPSVLEDDSFQSLLQIAATTFLGPDGKRVPLLRDEEKRQLSIRRGTLDDEERREIESHVTHSFIFLSQIPWTGDLARVPSIAYAHHEKLTGKGYPQGLSGDEIPVQARMMTISDIFDALTATDRPYKPAVPLDRAFTILGFEAKDGNIDRELLDLFIERRVYSVLSDFGATEHMPVHSI